jgi:hypothetical protein
MRDVKDRDSFGRSHLSSDDSAGIRTKKLHLSVGHHGRMWINYLDGEIGSQSGDTKNGGERETEKNAHSILLFTRKGLR